MPLTRFPVSVCMLLVVTLGCGSFVPGPFVDGYPGINGPGANGPVLIGPSGSEVPIELAPVGWENPAYIPQANRDLVWEQVVDVVDDYFRIERENRVRLVGNVLTEGRIDTYPQGGATWLEPHLGDSVGRANRLESTLQTIRRRAVVRVIPADGGFLVDVVVTKELEDLPHPERATAGAASFRYDNSLPSRIVPPDAKEMPRVWIPQGRDAALEQQILAQLLARLGPVMPSPMPY